MKAATLEKVVALRNQLVNIPNSDHEEAIKLSNQITDSLKSIFALAENTQTKSKSKLHVTSRRTYQTLKIRLHIHVSYTIQLLLCLTRNY